MKKLFSVYFLFQFATSTFGQSSDSSITATGYIGILNQNSYPINGDKKTSTANLRVAGAIKCKLRPELTYHSFGVFQTSPNETYGLQIHFLEYRPSKRWRISAGYMPRLATEQRPFPPTANGQFETWTQAQIPGAAFGFKTKYLFKEDVFIGASISARKHEAQYDLALQYKTVTIAGYYSNVKKGVATTLDTKNVYAILVYDDVIVANTTVVTIVPKHKISLWSDAGYSHEGEELVRCEVGALKSFEIKKLNGLLAFGYDVKRKSITGYLFIHKLF